MRNEAESLTDKSLGDLQDFSRQEAGLKEYTNKTTDQSERNKKSKRSKRHKKYAQPDYTQSKEIMHDKSDKQATGATLEVDRYQHQLEKMFAIEYHIFKRLVLQD